MSIYTQALNTYFEASTRVGLWNTEALISPCFPICPALTVYNGDCILDFMRDRRILGAAIFI